MAYQAEIKSLLSFDNKEFKSKIDDTGESADSLKDKFGEVGKAVGGAFVVKQLSAFAKEAMRVGDQIDNLTKEVDFSAESVQSLQVASKEAGITFETLRPTINQMRRAVEEAKAGNDNYTKAFDKMGLSIEDIKSMKTEEIFESLGRTISESSDNAEIMANSTKLLGAESTRLLPILKSVGSEGFDALNARMRETGQIISNDVISNLDKAQEAWERSGTAAKNFGFQAVGAVAGFGQVMSDALDFITRSGEEMIQIAETEAWLAEREKEKAAESAKQAAALEEQTALAEAIAGYEKKRSEETKTALTLEEQRKQLSSDIEIINKKLVEYGSDQNLQSVDQIGLLTQRDELTKQISAIEEKIASDLKAQQVEREKELLSLQEQYHTALVALFDYTNQQRLSEMNDEQMLAELRQRQIGDEMLLGTLDKDKLEDRVRMAKIQLDIEKRADAIKKLEQDVAKAASDAAGSASAMSSSLDDSKDGAENLRSELKDLNQFEMGNLKINMLLLQTTLQDIAAKGGFPDIKLPDLSKFTLPQWMLEKDSTDRVRNFINALKSLSLSMKGQDFSGLSAFADLKLPDMKDFDAEGLVNILKASADANFGEFKIKVDYPEMGIPIDASALKLDSIADSLSILAGLKGVIFK